MSIKCLNCGELVTRMDGACLSCQVADLRRQLAEARDDSLLRRRSLAMEIREGLKVRGFWVPVEVDSSDLIMAVAKALDSLREQRDEAQAALRRIADWPYDIMGDCVADPRGDARAALADKPYEAAEKGAER